MAKLERVDSFDGTRHRIPWQSSQHSITDRVKHLYNNSIMSDVEFVVFDRYATKVHIPAHSFILEISSPNISSVIWPKSPKPVQVKFEWVNKRSLLEFLRYVYCDEINLAADTVVQVLLLAVRFQVPFVAKRCVALLKGQGLHAQTVFTVLKDIRVFESRFWGVWKSYSEVVGLTSDEFDIYERRWLQKACWQLIDRDSREALRSQAFLALRDLDIIVTLVERETIRVTEVELFQALNCWCALECERQGRTADGKGKREVLGERIIDSIRFPVMEEEDFAKYVVTSGILSSNDVRDMFTFYHDTSPDAGAKVRFSKTPRVD